MEKPDTKFSPPWWLRNPHLQTIWASKFSHRPEIQFEVERVELPDGDFFDLAKSAKDTGPVVLLFHGLAGSINSAYARGAFSKLENAGYRPTLMHWRGCSGEPNRLVRSYHSGSSDDIQFVINLMRSRYPTEPLYAIGYSLGANALVKYLGEQGDQSPLRGALAVCPPFVMSIGADKLNSGLAKGYQRHLLSEMTKHHEIKQQRYPALKMTTITRSIKQSFWAWDDAITAPVNGFKDVHDYYESCSCRSFLPGITIPTHILYALDDPFFTKDVLPNASELPPSVKLEVQRYGGHVGFVFDKNTPSRDNWLDCWVIESLTQLPGS
ncbi:MAG: hydrolase [Gammaproteobacteria bacterium]|nr:hydrolase [Gammaproteobacteria bacterium]